MRVRPGVAPLDATWQAHLEGLARARGWPVDLRAVAAGVRRLSDAYNQVGRAPAVLDPALQAARLLFFLPRDAPKAAVAVRALAPDWAGDRPLRLLDVGAGLGATTLGVLRALRAAGHTGSVEVVALDAEPTAVRLLPDVLRPTGARVTATHADARSLPPGRFDLVLLGQVLCELDLGLSPDVRAARHADWIDALAAERLLPGGAVVVVEPALRVGARHLMAVRDQVAARGRIVRYPCTHGLPCPMRARERDWCHEWADVDLPGWLQPVAREAGLRWEGVSLARLVVQPDGRAPRGWRATADVRWTNGRGDLWACGEGSLRAFGRLDRHRSETNAAWDELSSGDRFTLSPADAKIGPTAELSLEDT